MSKLENSPLGPKTKKLLAEIIAKESIPPGGGIEESLKFFTDEDHRKQILERSWKNLETISTVQSILVQL